MSDHDIARQRDQIEKIWDTIDVVRNNQERHYTEFREIKTTIIGVDGKNGLRGRTEQLEEEMEKTQEKINQGHLSCPIAKRVEDHLRAHEKKEGDVLTAKRFYVVQLLTIILFIAGILLKR